MPISGFDLKIKIRAIQKNFPFSFFSFFFFFQTITIRYQNFLSRITHPVHANYTVVYPRTHPRYTQYIQIHLFYTSRYIACTRDTARYTNEGLCVGLRLKRESSMTPRTLQDFPRAWVQVQGQVHRATCQSVLVTIGLPASLRTLKNRFHDRNLDSELHPLRRHSTFAG